MTRMTTLLSVVMMGLSTSAFAFESEESLVADLDLGLHAASDADHLKMASRTGRRGRGATRSATGGSRSARTGRATRSTTRSATRSNGNQASTTRSSSSRTTRAVQGRNGQANRRGQQSVRSQSVTQTRGANTRTATRTGSRTTTQTRSHTPPAGRTVAHTRSTRAVPARTHVTRSAHTTHVTRPARTVVRPGRTVVTRPVVARRTTVVRPRTRFVSYRTVRPYHGVFVYGPRPTTHVVYRGGGNGGRKVQVKKADLPSRAVDRSNSLAVGLTMGTLHSGFENSGGYGDLGIGLAARYRPVESVGLQVDLKHHGAALDNTANRDQTHLSASAQLFAFPWTRVQPYVSLGVTGIARDIEQDVASFDGTSTYLSQHDSTLGLHGGVGVELALGKSIALDFEARYIGVMSQSPDAQTLPGAVTTTGGLMFHF